jgi:hypothetical protein
VPFYMCATLISFNYDFRSINDRLELETDSQLPGQVHSVSSSRRHRAGGPARARSSTERVSG